MSGWNNEPTDLRGARKRDERRLVIAVVVALLIVGGLVIGLVYGQEAVITGLLCLVPGAAGLVLIWLLLRWLDHVAKREE